MGRTTRDGAIDQAQLRELMQTQAREQARLERPSREQFRTPEWVDHSFVLPDDQTPAHLAAASHPVPQPRMKAPDPLPVFERPAAPQVDFAAVVRRADVGRQARLATATALLVAVCALVAFQLAAQPVLGVVAIVAALVAIGGAATRIVLNRAPVPYLED